MKTGEAVETVSEFVQSARPFMRTDKQSCLACQEIHTILCKRRLTAIFANLDHILCQHRLQIIYLKFALILSSNLLIILATALSPLGFLTIVQFLISSWVLHVPPTLISLILLR